MNEVRNKALLDAVWKFHSDHRDSIVSAYEFALEEVLEELPEAYSDALDDSFAWWPNLQHSYVSQGAPVEHTKFIGWFILQCDLSTEDLIWVLCDCISESTRQVSEDENDTMVDSDIFFNKLEKSCS